MANNDRDRIILNATVSEIHRGGLFIVVLDNGNKILVKPCGKIQQNLIKIVAGDKVKIEVSPYDTSKGRIISRIK